MKPRKVNQNKAKNDTFDRTQINALILTLSAIVASRPNMEHWMLTEKEVDSITEPLAKMLAESETLSKLTENSNQIALAVACVTVFAPRVILTLTKIKQGKENMKVVRDQQTTKTKTDIEKSTGRNDKRSSTNDTNDRSSQPFYGLPVA